MRSPGADPGAGEAPLHRAFGRLLAGAPSGAERPDELGRWLLRHRMGPYAWRLAREVDPALAEHLHAAAADYAALSLILERWAARLLRDLAARGIRPVLFKGLGVAATLYPAVESRPLGDLDILVPRPELERAVEVAEKEGFSQESDDPAVRALYRDYDYNVPMVHPEHGVVELHHRLYRDCSETFVAELLRRVRPASVLGVRVAVLAPSDLFLVLAAHWCLSDPGSTWVWLLDLVLLGRTLDDDAWRAIADDARAHGLEVFVVAALEWMDRLWGVGLPRAAPASALRADLSRLERLAVDAFACVLSGRPYPADRLRLARRLAGRPVRGGLLDALVCHPGVVCLERGISSRSRWFLLHRAAHAGARAARIARGMARAIR